MLDSVELLAPVGNQKKLEIALHYGADAVYLGGPNFGLRAYAGNFDNEKLKQAVKYVHSFSKKIYVTVNIYASNDDFIGLGEYLIFLESIGVDAIIVSDIGIVTYCRQVVPKLEIHISTQANVTNYMSAKAFADLGAKRIVLARELSLKEIKEIRKNLPQEIELEAFVHGAMCVSYSGRCLLSTYLTPRNSNRGECVQSCRWEYTLTEKSRPDKPLTIAEDQRGTYIMNSKDLNMIDHINELIDAGIKSFKIEGRMKSEYYVATVTNAYRRSIDNYYKGISDDTISRDLFKTANRQYTTGFYYKGTDLDESKQTINYENAQSVGDYEFVGFVYGYDEEKKAIIVEQRNRFMQSDELEILSNGNNHNKTFIVGKMFDIDGKEVTDAKIVQQMLYIPCEYRLTKYDILRKKVKV